MKRMTLTTVLLASALAVAPAYSQTAAQHDEHHPQQDTTTAPAPAAPPSSAPTSQPGMNGMGGMPMMKMMGDGAGMDMPRMMQMMNMMHSGMAGCGSAPSTDQAGAFDRIEGRIAFLRAELRITETQAAAWNAFADALRTQARARQQLQGQDTQPRPASLLERLDRRERGLAARLEGIRALKGAFAPLFAALSDDQKKTADELLSPYLGTSVTSGSGKMGPGMMRSMQPASGKSAPGMGR